MTRSSRERNAEDTEEDKKNYLGGEKIQSRITSELKFNCFRAMCL